MKKFRKRKANKIKIETSNYFAFDIVEEKGYCCLPFDYIFRPARGSDRSEIAMQSKKINYNE